MAEPTRLGLQPAIQVGFQQARREDVLTEWTGALQRAGVLTWVGSGHELTAVGGEQGSS